VLIPLDRCGTNLAKDSRAVICTNVPNFIHKTGNTQRLAMPSVKVMSNMHKNFSVLWFSSYMQAERQTNRQTNEKCNRQSNLATFSNNPHYCHATRDTCRILCAITIVLTLTLMLTSSVTWPFEPQLVVSYWSCDDIMSLSRTIAEILSVKNNWVTNLTPSCHVTSSVTWPSEPQLVVSYWSSVDTMTLSPTVADILSVIIWIIIFHCKHIGNQFWGFWVIGDYAMFQ